MSSAPLDLSLVLLHSHKWELLGNTETLLAEALSVHSPGKVWSRPTYQTKNVWEIPLRSWLLGGNRWPQEGRQALGKAGMEAP